MKISSATTAFAALANETRLKVFRLLVRQGPGGMAAGDIARRLKVAPPTLSSHLAQLERSGLICSWRVERHIYYALEIEGTRRLLRYLTEDCCQGHPELCGDLLAAGDVCD
ncbi:MAG: metalloregulator ArsR/SmtB family transcription factor [Pseudomonadota bacterium]